MQLLRRIMLPVLLATIWISISEFVRNQILLKQVWIEHYTHMGLVFPLEPINGAMWGVWSLLLAAAIFIVAKKFTLVQTALLVWLVAFIMMWVVIGNLAVLPFGILQLAIPLSLLEVFVASFIIKKLS